MPRVETRTRIVLLRHAAERWKPSSTARLAALAMPNLVVVDYGLPGAPVELGRLPTADAAWLLFPDGPAPPPGAPLPVTLVVVDGTWQQARRMAQRLAPLHLPRLRLPAPPGPRPRLRHAHRDDGMTTLEAIAHAMGVLEGDAVRRPLLALHDLHVQRTLEAVGPRGFVGA